MSYLAFQSRGATIRLPGREVHHIAAAAQDALADELSRPGRQQLRADLGLPAVDSMFFASQIFWLMSDGETHHLQGHDVYVFDLALNVLYSRQPAAGILCWLYVRALGHGWVTGADRHAFASEIQAALDAGAARPGMHWDAIIAFLRDGTDDVVTSLSAGREFPDSQLAIAAGTWSPDISNPEDPGDELDALWDQMKVHEQWERCERALRSEPLLRWTPGGASYVFGEYTIQQGAGLVLAPRPGQVSIA